MKQSSSLLRFAFVLSPADVAVYCWTTKLLQRRSDGTVPPFSSDRLFLKTSRIHHCSSYVRRYAFALEPPTFICKHYLDGVLAQLLANVGKCSFAAAQHTITHVMEFSAVMSGRHRQVLVGCCFPKSLQGNHALVGGTAMCPIASQSGIALASARRDFFD